MFGLTRRAGAVLAPLIVLASAPGAIAMAAVPAHLSEAEGGRLTAGSSAGPPPAGGPLQTCAADGSSCASLSSFGIATVRCAVACNILFFERRGSHTVRRFRTLTPETSAHIFLVPHALKWFGPGRVRVTVYVNGAALTARTLLLHSPR